MKKIIIYCWFILSIFQLSVSTAKDIEGSKDHPMFSRYEGSKIVAYQHNEFNEYTAVTGPAKGPYYEVKWEKTEELEGSVTRILYRAPQGRSSLEVYRNYQTELENNGFESLFECKKEACGQAFFTMPQPVWKDSGWVRDVFVTNVNNQRYLAAKLTRDEGDIYAFVYVSEHTFMSSMAGTYVHLDIVEMKPMETAMVKVDAETIAKDISSTGHIAIYGIYFDTDKAVIKPESKPAIDEIAKLMKEKADLKLYVVGHTDNQGAVQYNMDLSHKRATAIRDELVNAYGINIDRLGAVGMGFFAPVTSNKTKEGRALNRRVELVEWNE